MAEETPQTPEQPSIEQAQRTAREAFEARQAPERPAESAPERPETLTEEEEREREQIREELEHVELPVPKQKQAQQQSITVGGLSPKEQLERLVTIAFEDGPEVAVTAARKLQDAYILDALHDALAKDKLYQKLKETGQI